MRASQILWLFAGAFLLAVACSGKSDPATVAPCPIGTEACPCTQGGACDPGLTCLSDLCVKRTGSGTSTAATGASGASGAGGPTSTTSGAGGSGTGSGGGTGTTSGTGGGATAPPVCHFPVAKGTAAEKGDPTGQSKDSLSAEFAGGRLTKLDGKTCAPDATGAKATGDWGSYPCVDAYSCGGCLVFLLDENETAEFSPWTLLGAYSATDGKVAGCPEYSGVYGICIPNCTNKTDAGTTVKVCGNDGCNGSCGSCGASPACCNKGTCAVDQCAQCLDACSGLPGCCTGVGCQCQGACGTKWCEP